MGIDATRTGRRRFHKTMAGDAPLDPATKAKVDAMWSKLGYDWSANKRLAQELRKLSPRDLLTLFLLSGLRNSIPPLASKKVPKCSWPLRSSIPIAFLLLRFPKMTSGIQTTACVMLREFSASSVFMAIIVACNLDHARKEGLNGSPVTYWGGAYGCTSKILISC